MRRWPRYDLVVVAAAAATAMCVAAPARWRTGATTTGGLGRHEPGGDQLFGPRPALGARTVVITQEALAEHFEVVRKSYEGMVYASPSACSIPARGMAPTAFLVSSPPSNRPMKGMP